VAISDRRCSSFVLTYSNAKWSKRSLSSSKLASQVLSIKPPRYASIVSPKSAYVQVGCNKIDGRRDMKIVDDNGYAFEPMLRRHRSLAHEPKAVVTSSAEYLFSRAAAHQPHTGESSRSRVILSAWVSPSNCVLSAWFVTFREVRACLARR
jgi:hypothetical protein